MQESGKIRKRVKRIERQAKQWFSFFMIVVLVVTMCSVSDISVAAGELITIDKGNDGISDQSVVSDDSTQDAQGKFDVSMTAGTDHVTAELSELAQEGYYKLVISGSGKMKDMSALERPWQEQINTIREVEIKGAVSYIGTNAFHNMECLAEVTFASEADSFEIGEMAFSSCTDINKLDFSGVKLTKIGDMAFKGCSLLSEITFPALGEPHTLTLGESAFDSCYALEEVFFPEQTRVIIGEEAFRCCKNLKKVYALHPETAFQGTYIFLENSNWNGKRNIDITIVCQKNSVADEFCAANDYATAEYVDADRPENDISAEGEDNHVAYSLSDDGVLTIEGYGAMKDYTSFEDVPWFDERMMIQSVVFQGAITHIGEMAFGGLSNCHTISFDGMTADFSIAENAFATGSVTSLSFPDKMKELKHWAFVEAIKLQNVDIHGGTIVGNPFMKLSADGVDHDMTISFYDTAKTNLEKYDGSVGLGFKNQNNMNLIFDSGDAIEKYKNNIEWTYVNDIYVPYGSSFASLPQTKDNGCNVTYSISEDGMAHIKSIQNNSFASQLNLPEAILGHKVTSVDCTIPSGLSILHTGISHIIGKDGVCKLCGKKKYQVEESDEGERFVIPNLEDLFDEEAYIILIIEEEEYEQEQQYFVLTRDVVLQEGWTLSIPRNCTLFVPEGVSFTVGAGAKLILDGTIVVEDGGTFFNKGDISGNGQFEGTGDFLTVPTQDTIVIEGEEFLYEGMPDFEIRFQTEQIKWLGVYFDIVYSGTAKQYFEQFTGTYPSEEADPEKWEKLTDAEAKNLKCGIYRFVYEDTLLKFSVYKRFEVGKPVGNATISIQGWQYGDEPDSPVYGTTTNKNRVPKITYKKKAEGDDAYTQEVPSLPGEYTVQVVYPANETHQSAIATADFVIAKRAVTIQIANAEKTYGQENPTFSCDIVGEKGLVGEDSLADLGIVLQCSATKESDAGKYPITAEAPENDYYAITIKSGELTVTPMTAVLTVDSSSLLYEKTFGEESFALTGITKTGDGTIRFAVDPAGTDILSVDAEGNVTITGVGETKVHVSLPDTKNATGASSVDISIKVAKAQAPETGGKLYYLCTQENEITISLADYLPADCGDVDYSGFDAIANVTYPQGDKTICSKTPKVDEAGILTLTTKGRMEEGTIRIEVPVSMAHYNDTCIKVEVNLLAEQETQLADGERVQIVEDGIYYGNALGTLTFGDTVFVGTGTGETVTGVLVFAHPSKEPEVGNGSYEADWIFTPDASYNGLYKGCTGKVTIKVYRATPAIDETPVALDQVYDPEKTLSMVRLIGGKTEPGGEWSWLKPNATVTCSNTGYDAVFTPNDQNYDTVIRKIPVTVKQAQPEIVTKPVTTAITYRETLKSSTLTGGKAIYKSAVSDNSLTYTITGSFSWVEETLMPTIADSDLSQYEVLFTPEDPNYAPVKTTATVHVKKSGFAPGFRSGLQHMRVDNTMKTVADVTGLPTDWEWKETDAAKAISQNDTCQATAVYNGADKGNYEYETMTYEIYREACQKAGELCYTMEGEVAPTCTKGGTGHKECMLCHDILETNVAAAALGHSYDVPQFAYSISENSPADTTAQAIYVCTRKGCQENETGHRHVENCRVTYQKTDPACEQEGEVIYEAAVTFLGKTEQDTKTILIPSLGHDYNPVYFDPQEALPEQAATVSDNNAGKTCFVWGTGDRTCSVAFVCKRCAKEETVTVGTAAKTTSTCTEDGIKTITADISFAGYELHGEKQVFDPATGHHFYNWERKVFPTCTEAGYDIYSCIASDCDVTRKQPLDPLGHKGGTATCAHAAVCDRCGESYGDLDPDNHEQDEIRDALQPSCLTDGYTGDTYCMACQKLLQQGKLIFNPNKMHTWDEGVVIREATVLQNGQKKYTCRKCDAVRLQVLYYEKPADENEPTPPGDEEKPENETNTEDDMKPGNENKPEEKTDDKKENIYHVEEDPAKPGKVVVIYVKPVKPKKTVVIPATVKIGGKKYAVTGIDKNAFVNDKTITKVTVGKNVTEIPDGCFSGCENLTSVTLPDSVKKIGSKSFYQCKKLATVKIGKNVTTIGDRAFAGCIKLQKITIPAKVIRLGSSLFYGDKRLKTIVIRTKKLTDKRLNKKTFRGVGQKVVIKVPKTKRKTYQKLFQKKGLTKKNKLKSL